MLSVSEIDNLILARKDKRCQRQEPPWHIGGAFLACLVTVTPFLVRPSPECLIGPHKLGQLLRAYSKAPLVSIRQLSLE